MSAQPLPRSREVELHERALELLEASGPVVRCVAEFITFVVGERGFVSRAELLDFALILAALEVNDA